LTGEVEAIEDARGRDDLDILGATRSSLERGARSVRDGGAARRRGRVRRDATTCDQLVEAWPGEFTPV
jgi:hypothetical protein